MKPIPFLPVPAFCLFAFLLWQPAAQAADLTIRIEGAAPKGNLLIRLHDREQGFRDGSDAVARFVLPPRDGGAAVTLHDLPAGRYAAAAFQDEDGNQILSSNILGIPNEPYGWSGGADSADFAKASTMLTDAPASLTIRLR